MADSSYMLGRRKYARPQAMLFSDSAPQRVVLNEGTPDESFIFVPPGVETLSSTYTPTTSDSFIVVSDHNRGEIDFSTERIEKRERMINGRMRSYHIADKISLSTSWTDLPSRAFSDSPEIGSNGKQSAGANGYTVDGGAGGADLLEWYENHSGSFWIYLSYDKPQEFAAETNPYGHLGKYTEFFEVFFSNFQYSVSKRGANTHDFWNVSLSLEEV